MVHLPSSAARFWRVFLLSAGLLGGTHACGDPYQEFPLDQVCRDVGYAIAARSLDCTSDPDLAQRRYDQFKGQYRCLVTDLRRDPIDVYYHCTSQISGMSCEQVQAFGDDIRQYLHLSPTCAQFLEGPGLSSEAGGSAGSSGASGQSGEGGAGGDPGASGAGGAP